MQTSFCDRPGLVEPAFARRQNRSGRYPSSTTPQPHGQQHLLLSLLTAWPCCCIAGTSRALFGIASMTYTFFSIKRRCLFSRTLTPTVHPHHTNTGSQEVVAPVPFLSAVRWRASLTPHSTASQGKGNHDGSSALRHALNFVNLGRKPGPSIQARRLFARGSIQGCRVARGGRG